ncbi:MAG: beta-ketoacyl-[acyl-carrier-protein] synthase II [Acidobacteria bacterium]|nr:MAG: beta-ketoacyl-[acyl-carrier-protein] synthase II [Acidobacteriota bacterium]
MTERVAVTGAGVVAPTGIGVEAFGQALRRGRSGTRPITAFACDGLDTRIGAQVDDAAFDPAAFVHPPKLLKLMSRPATFAVAAAAMARSNAALGPEDVDPDRLGVCLGAGGMGPLDLDLLAGQAMAVLDAASDAGTPAFDVPSFARAFRARTNPLSMLRGLPNLAAAHVAIQQGARGPNTTVATACTAGTQAIGDALRTIQRGEADVMLAGGADSMINPVGLLGFSMLGTLSCRNDEAETACRPFDRDRDGFVIGEGAAVIVLERESFARARGATVWAELAGCSATCDAYRITDERPDGSGPATSIRRCLRDAGAEPADVGYINAHGTGTQMNDRIETQAIKRVFGDAVSIPVSSTKSMTGHLLAAAGAVELVACLLALQSDFLPPTINYRTPDPECDLDCVPNAARLARFDAALSNSFGFGGQNACLMIRRW